MFDRIWRSERPLVPVEIFRALGASGNQAAAAFDGDEMVGAILGFLGFKDASVILHSHILGVVAEYRGRGIGLALKRHQRAWARSAGIERVTWTFDPLVRRNAVFNFNRLGVAASRYLENFYGQMHDAINAGEETDRLLVEWATREIFPARLALSRDLPNLIEETTEGPEFRPSELHGTKILCGTPEDIESLRTADPGRARRWRLAMRAALVHSLQSGFRIQGVTSEGSYLLARP